MRAENEGAATPARVFAASSATCNCDEKCNPCRCKMQPAKTSWSGRESFHRTPEEIKQADEDAALCKLNYCCSDCGKYVGNAFVSCSSQKLARRGPIVCEQCFSRREALR